MIRDRPDSDPIASWKSKKQPLRVQPKILSKVITLFESKLGSGRLDLRRMASRSQLVESMLTGTLRGDSLGLLAKSDAG
jgi:hypothetical protein